jgi:hypothetical protein
MGSNGTGFSQSPDYESCRSLINRQYHSQLIICLILIIRMLLPTAHLMFESYLDFIIRICLKTLSSHNPHLILSFMSKFSKRVQSYLPNYSVASNSYFYQITMGCGTVHCTNRNCFACPEGPRLDPTSAALLAVKLAQSPTHYLCAGAAISVPQSLQWVDVPANADVVPLRKILAPALEASNVQAQARIQCPETSTSARHAPCSPIIGSAFQQNRK